MTENQKQLKILFKKKYQSKYHKHEPYSGDYEYDNLREGSYIIDNDYFEAELEYIDYDRGRSALNAVWRDKKLKREYCSSMHMLHAAVRNNKIKNSKIKGKFIFKKQGTSILLDFEELY